MATSDLCNELQKNLELDSALESRYVHGRLEVFCIGHLHTHSNESYIQSKLRICASILKQLDDKSNDVQSIAVKCLGILVTKVHEAQVGQICDKLCDLILNGTHELRDIYSIGIKTLIGDVPESMGTLLTSRLSCRLLVGISSNEDSIKMECLDILTDLMRRFGLNHYASNSSTSHHAELTNLLTSVQHELLHDRMTIRKRVISCLGALGPVLSVPLLNQLMDGLLSELTNKSTQHKNATIQALGTLARTVGHRMGPYLDVVVPLLIQVCDGHGTEESNNTPLVNESRENCLLALESFIRRCPEEVTPHIEKFMTTSLGFMTYDPNYSYEEEDSEMDEDQKMDDQEMEEDFSDLEDDEGNFSDDDDDTSWKVRRAALRVLKSIIVCRVERLDEFIETRAPELIRRFKEREENVRLDVVSCVREMIRHSTGSCSLLERHVPALMKASVKQLSVGHKVSSMKTKSAVLSMLSQLVQVLPQNGLKSSLPSLVPAVLSSLEDHHSSLKLDALVCLRLILSTHDPSCFTPYVDTMVPHVTQCAKEDWYKLIAETLRVLGILVHVVVCDHPEKHYSQSFVLTIFEATMTHLVARDSDQEIKECAIASMGRIVSSVGHEYLSSDQLSKVLRLFLERLSNEVSRTATLKALTKIVSSSQVKIEVFDPEFMAACMTQLGQFLRQQSRVVKHTTLDTLLALVHRNHDRSSSMISSTQLDAIVVEGSNLVSDQDLHLSHLTLELVHEMMLEQQHQSESNLSPEAIHGFMTLGVLTLAQSPLLQGPALESLVKVLQTLCRRSTEFQNLLLKSLISPIQDSKSSVSKQSMINVARCVASVVVVMSPKVQRETLLSFIQNIEPDQNANPMTKRLALRCLGEIGRRLDVSSYLTLRPAILSSFQNANEEIKSAAAGALGDMTAGNMTTYLPGLLSSLESSTEDHVYLLLSSLKEVITCYSSGGVGLTNDDGHDDDLNSHSNHQAFRPVVAQVLPILQVHCESPEEGVRKLVAECLGKMVLIDDRRVLPYLMEHIKNSGNSEHLRWTCVTALRYCMIREEMLEVVTPYLVAYVEALVEEVEDTVLRASLGTLNAIVHHQPKILLPFWTESIFPKLCHSMTIVKTRTVDLGPFKHKVDDGLVLRKAAFGVMNTLLEVYGSLDCSTFFRPYLHAGLKDHDDVQMLCHQIVVQLCSSQPRALVVSPEVLKSVLDPLEVSVNRKVKDSKVGTEVERANDVIRNALRAIDALSQVPEIARTQLLVDVICRIEKKEKLAAMLTVIRSERVISSSSRSTTK